RRPFEAELWVEQLYQLGVRSLTITNVTLLFTGMVLAIQTAYSLAVYGVKSFVGDIVALSVVRELGPVLTALMVAGRVGAGITAELGSMAVTEQIDALRALAASPVRKLVIPRVGALVVALPILTILADTVALFGGLVMAIFEVGQTRVYYMNHTLGALTVQDIISGVGKTVFFAFFIGIIACYNGMGARGGADGVGKATT
ncbi:MAG: ABC transporter permease, partial [Actinomycetia bacterium]|nr:ABC transporter permease [Actinomycetes bacterium]